MFREKLLGGGITAPRPLLVEGRRFYPTEARLPAWARARLLTALALLQIADIKVRLLSEKPDFKGLLKPKFAPYLPETLDPRVYLERVKREVPVDGTEIVEWMHGCFVDQAILDARLDEYNRVGSQVVGLSNDPFIPGVVVEDCSLRSEMGIAISDRGYAIAQTPRGNFNVDVGGKKPGIFRDLITWGAAPWVGYTQWIGMLLKWKTLANTPITSTVGFPASVNPFTGDFLSAPQFVVMSPSRPALRVSVTETFSCSEAERLEIVYRDPNDYTRILARDWISLPAGQSEVSYTVVSFPYVPPTVHEMDPEDNKLTVLNRFTTSP